MNDDKTIKMGYEQAGAEAQAQLGDCLWDAHAAGSKIVEFTTGRTFEEFQESDLLQSVVRKMLEIMVESLTEMRRHFPDEFARLDGGGSLIDGSAEDAGVWRLVKDIVPEMVLQLQTRLDEWHQA